jgi:hypothetical protein
MSEVEDILAQIRSLLEKHGHDGQASVIAELEGARKNDPNAYRERVRSVDLWGGSGAVWDVCLACAEPPSPSEREDERCFRSSIIALAQAMDREGLGTERSRFIADTFSHWTAKEM